MLSLSGDMIKTVISFKYLGICLDSHLQFHDHVDQIVDKAATKLGLLYKTRWLFDEETALMMYKSLTSPHIDFGFVVYEVCPKYQLQRLQVIQNDAARMILLEDQLCPIYELHEWLKLDTLATRRSKSMVTLTYSCLYDEEPLYLCEQLKPINHGNRITRAISSGVLVVPRVNTKYGQSAVGFRAPVQWNLTKIELKSTVNKIQLKSLLRTSW